MRIAMWPSPFMSPFPEAAINFKSAEANYTRKRRSIPGWILITILSYILVL
jgi:hypothetical protein